MSGSLGGNALSILDEYRQCSFRGVPFAVIGSGGSAGRKVAVHDYPWRDNPWPEDLGRRGRGFRVRGFVTGDLFRTQFDLLLLAVEQKGPGLLIHPTRGLVQASVLNFDWREPDLRAGVIEFELALIEARSLLSTTILVAAHAAIAIACATLSSGCSSDFAADTAAPFLLGSRVFGAGQARAVSWAVQASTLSRAPTVTAAALSTLPGSYGRYVSANAAVVPGATLSSALDGVTLAQAAVDAAGAAVAAATTAADLATAILAVPEALRTGVSDPGAQITLLSELVAPTAAPATGTAPIGTAIALAETAAAAMCRRAALGSIAIACSDYQPTSFDDAEALRAQVGALLAAEIVVAGDAGDDATFQALRTLRAQVLADLADRASQLGHLTTVTRNAPLPAPVLGQQLYADGSRASDLIQRADPVHPLFMPTSFEALAT